MPKVKIKVQLKTEEINDSYETAGIINRKTSTITYFEKNNTKVVFNYKNNTLTRSNNELNMEYTFDIENTTYGLIKVKELKQKLEIPIKTNKLSINDKNIKVEYIIENEKYMYYLEVKEN